MADEAYEERQGNGNLNHDRRLREDVFNYGEPSQASPPTIMRQRAKNSSPTKLCLVQLVVPGVSQQYTATQPYLYWDFYLG